MKRIPPPVLALAAGLAQRALTGTPRAMGPARRTAAGTVALASVGLAGSAAESFRRQGTTVDPLEPGRAAALVTTGVNALTRNPMYVGMAGLLVANALRRGSWVALLPVAGFVLVIDRWQIAAEEPALLANFGSDYEEYCRRVPRWWGRGSLSAAVRSLA